MAHLLDSISEEEGDNLLAPQDPIKAAKALRRDIASLVVQLESPPIERPNMDKFIKDGEVLKTQSKSQTTEMAWAEVRSDILSFYTAQGGEHVTSHRVCWVYSCEIAREDNVSAATGNKSAWRITIFSRGYVFILAFATDEVAKDWAKFFKSMMKAKYSTEERSLKESITTELMPLLTEQEKMKAKQFQRIMDTLAESGFFIEAKAKKEYEGYLEVRVAKKQWKKVYCALFSDFLYMFPPHEKVSVDTEPYDWIELNFINSIRPSKVPNTIVVRTLLNRFTFRAKHEVAVAEWINALRAIRVRQTGATLNKIEVSSNDNGYMYTRDLEGKISLSWSVDGKSKSKKLKGKESGIGRSSSNSVCIENDKYISRAHAKIVLENNVPYIVDLGSSAGTKLNGKRVTKVALKPGDIIEVGKTQLLVEIKHAEEIFVTIPKAEPEAEAPEPQAAPSEAPKKKKKKSTNSSPDENGIELDK